MKTAVGVSLLLNPGKNALESVFITPVSQGCKHEGFKQAAALMR
jgi:hypothetical protein